MLRRLPRAPPASSTRRAASNPNTNPGWKCDWPARFRAQRAREGRGAPLPGAPARLRRAALYERRGDRSAAAVDYAAVVKVWQGSDAQFRSLLDSVRAGLARVRQARDAP